MCLCPNTNWSRRSPVRGDPYLRQTPRQSVNRGSLSEPEDALFDEGGKYDGLGVVYFNVESIPPQLTGEQGSSFRFSVHHEPLEENYSHSEIWSERAGVAGEYREPSRSVKMGFRIELAMRIVETNIMIPAVRNKK